MRHRWSWREIIPQIGSNENCDKTLSLTQGTMRLVRQAMKGFRLVGSLTFGLDGRRCRWYRSPLVRLGTMQHDEEPHEGQQSELVVQKV